MFFIPIWITNFLFLAVGWLSGWQLMRLKRPNPVTNLQFVMAVFCIIMVVVVALYNRANPWLSLVFLLIAVGCLGVMIRRHRMLPPVKRFE